MNPKDTVVHEVAIVIIHVSSSELSHPASDASGTPPRPPDLPGMPVVRGPTFFRKIRDPHIVGHTGVQCVTISLNLQKDGLVGQIVLFTFGVIAFQIEAHGP